MSLWGMGAQQIPAYRTVNLSGRSEQVNQVTTEFITVLFDLMQNLEISRDNSGIKELI